MAKFVNRGLEDLDITKQELKELGEALKKEEFRKLLSEYVDEVNDPQNRALYENEMTQLEKQRGVDITFIHPQPGYVIKTSVDGVQKAFINICCNENIDKPTSVGKVIDGVQGSNWMVPHILTPPKVDLDKKGQRCVVYDVVFNPLSLEIAKTNLNFKSLLNDTAISGIEDAFSAKVDRNNIRFPKIDFKGPKIASIIRKKSADKVQNEEPPLDIPNYPYEPLISDRSPKVTNPRRCKPEKNSKPIYTTPKYIVKHRKGIDLQEFTYMQDAKMNAAIPTEIVIEIDLPLLSSAGDAILDVTSRALSLVSEKPSKYKLDLDLPYCVDESNGSAKFDKKAKKLIINLPVLQRKFDPFYFSRDDSGIESDPSHNRSSSDEDLSNPKIEVLSSSEKLSEGDSCINTLRTNIPKNEFLSNDLHYTFPSFQLSNNHNSITLTVNVKNIEPCTVSHQFVLSGSGVHFKFSSLGAGCFPLHYAICVQFPGFLINTSTLKVEVWDNNLIIDMDVSSSNGSVVSSYSAGPSIDALLPKDLSKSADIESDMLQELDHFKETQEKLNNISLRESFEELHSKNETYSFKEEISIGTDSIKKEETNENCDINANGLEITSTSQSVIKPPKVRTYSESNAIPPCTPFSRRSILKTSRSLSESHSDEYTTWSSLDSSDITEDSACQPVKKTVRFSDVISKKIFRANSSILGQKHKNEKKSRNRKKCATRRKISENSEPENSEVSDFSDYSEVSDISDVSDVSDASSDDLPNPPVELSSGKRHRRRGSKNSRKNAATAKQNSFILSQD